MDIIPGCRVGGNAYGYSGPASGTRCLDNAATAAPLLRAYRRATVERALDRFAKAVPTRLTRVMAAPVSPNSCESRRGYASQLAIQVDTSIGLPCPLHQMNNAGEYLLHLTDLRIFLSALRLLSVAPEE